MTKAANPVRFSTVNMTVSQLMECADLLRTVFDALERGVDEANICRNLRQTRDSMSRRWSET